MLDLGPRPSRARACRRLYLEGSATIEHEESATEARRKRDGSATKARRSRAIAHAGTARANAHVGVPAMIPIVVTVIVPEWTDTGADTYLYRQL